MNSISLIFILIVSVIYIPSNNGQTINDATATSSNNRLSHENMLRTRSSLQKTTKDYETEESSSSSSSSTFDKDESVVDPTVNRCTDIQPWHDQIGVRYNCSWYATPTNKGHNKCNKYGHKFENFGKTANEACCACGGGIGGRTVADDTDASSSSNSSSKSSGRSSTNPITIVAIITVVLVTVLTVFVIWYFRRARGQKVGEIDNINKTDEETGQPNHVRFDLYEIDMVDVKKRSEKTVDESKSKGSKRRESKSKELKSKELKSKEGSKSKVSAKTVNTSRGSSKTVSTAKSESTEKADNLTSPRRPQDDTHGGNQERLSIYSEIESLRATIKTLKQKRDRGVLLGVSSNASVIANERVDAILDVTLDGLEGLCGVREGQEEEQEQEDNSLCDESSSCSSDNSSLITQNTLEVPRYNKRLNRSANVTV